jgi:putative transposase
MNEKLTEKPKNVDYFRIPRPLWRRIRRLLPKPKPRPRGGRPPADNRAIVNGIWYVLWTGCQWKAIHRDWFGVCSSVLHERFQAWQRSGLFLKLMTLMLRFYARQRGIAWLFQALDSKCCPAPLGGEASGKSPVDRSKQGSKVHLLVDQRGAPLSLHITGANVHDKWLADELIVSMVVARPDPEVVEQHICMDKGYDYPDVHQFVELEHYIVHIKHRRRRGEPVMEVCPIPGETQYPARRWVVERTLGWLTKRRSIRTRWCKKADNWLAFIQLACSHILMDMTVYG